MVATALLKKRVMRAVLAAGQSGWALQQCRAIVLLQEAAPPPLLVTLGVQHQHARGKAQGVSDIFVRGELLFDTHFHSF